MTWILEPKISYSNSYNHHSISAIVGSTWQQSITSTNFTAGSQYSSDALLGSIKGAGLTKTYNDDVTDYRYTSIYARLGYNWRQRYLINLTGRRDGSSRFGPGNRFGSFGAIGVAWIFSNEKILEQAKHFLNFGKIRASYGITGSDQIGDYRYYKLYDINEYKYDDGSVGYVPLSLQNSDYRWELTKKMEASIEVAFFENRLGLEVSWYLNRSSNQLIDFTLPAITGFASVLQNFPATIQNNGLETIVKGDVLNSDTWRWNVAFNISLPKNKLVRFDGIEKSPYATIYKVGAPLSVRNLYTYNGVNQETGSYEFVDENNDGQISILDRKVQNPNDRGFYGGLTNSIQYKSIEISFLLQFSKQQIPRYFPTSAPGRQNNQPVGVLNRWRELGDQTNIQKYSNTSDNYWNYINLIESNFNIVDANFVRLKTVSIAFRLPEKILKNIKLEDGRIFVQGQNIFTITRYSGLDPETGNGLPPLRMITAGLQFKL
jgi:hypothetical protein